MPCIPERAQVLIIGGGPAGSYAASCLSREGLDVVLLEASKFPRYHIGESMLPSMRHFLRFIDLEEKFLAHGFYKKVGAAFKLGQGKTEGYTDFVLLDKNNYSWNVVRSEADEMMLRHASCSGAKVFEQTKVIEVHFSEFGSRPVAVSWKDSEGNNGKTSFDFLIDASGRRGLLSTTYMRNRQFNQSLKNVAMWGYWMDTNVYKADTPRAGAPFFEALTDESGWAWFIPLHNGTTSIGIVMNQEIASRKRAPENGAVASSLMNFYLQQLQKAPTVTSLIGHGNLMDKEKPTTVKSASDYSYFASSYAGEGYRIIGDAGAFIDPFFSNGIHLAVSGALSASATICASIRGHCTELEACTWHTSRIGTSYIRFQIVVMSAYRQMRSQYAPVLAEVNEDNFERAFGHFRGIIQGNVDIATPSSKNITQEELARTLEFCAQAYVPSLPGDKDVERKIELVKFLASSETIDAVAASTLHGRYMRLERGSLGLSVSNN